MSQNCFGEEAKSKSVTKKCHNVTFFFIFARPKNPVISTVSGLFVTKMQKNL